MSRFDPLVEMTEKHSHIRRNRAQAGTLRVRRCVLVDGSPGVAVTMSGFVMMVSLDQAIEIADGLVDAVEAVNA